MPRNYLQLYKISSPSAATHHYIFTFNIASILPIAAGAFLPSDPSAPPQLTPPYPPPYANDPWHLNNMVFFSLFISVTVMHKTK